MTTTITVENESHIYEFTVDDIFGAVLIEERPWPGGPLDLRLEWRQDRPYVLIDKAVAHAHVYEPEADCE